MEKKTKKLLLWGVVLVFLVGAVALFIAGGDNSNPDTSTSVYSSSTLTAVEGSFDFTTILMGDGAVSHEFKVVNNGSESVTIGKIYTSCACTTAYVIDSSGGKYGKFGMPGHKGLRSSADVEVEPSESVMVEAVFDPAFHGPSAVGLAERSIYIETNSAQSPKLELKFRATVTR